MKGQYIGCVTGFSQYGQNQIFTPNHQVEGEQPPYIERLVAVGLVIVELLEPNEYEISINPTHDSEPNVCTHSPSLWSNPITWEMVNHPNQSGYISVSFDASGSPNFGLDLSVYNDIHKFFDELHNQASHHVPFEIDNQSNSVRIRYLPFEGLVLPPDLNSMSNTHSERLVTEKITNTYEKRGEFYVNKPENIGNMGETSICLADAFDETPIVLSCITRDYSMPIEM